MRRRLTVLAIAAFFSMIAGGRAAGQNLLVSGECPGRMNFRVTGASANGEVALIHAAQNGAWLIPPGNECAGTLTSLNPPVRLARILVADGSGVADVNAHIPPRVCGRRYVQAVDLETCSVTNVVFINS